MCILCKSKQTKNSIQGSKNHYDASCVSEIIEPLKKFRIIYQGYHGNMRHCIVLNWSSISKYNEAVCAFKDHLKADTTKSVTNTNFLMHLKCFDILRYNSKAVILVQTRHDQNPTTTEADIFINFNPLEANLRLSKMKPVKDDGVIIGCNNK